MNINIIITNADEWWAIEVPEIDGLFTQVPKRDDGLVDLTAIALMVKDAAQLLADDITGIDSFTFKRQ